MTREEAIVQIKGLKKFCEGMADSDESGSYVFDLDVQALDLALSALRPVSRERVEKMWRGKWIIPTIIGGRAYNIPHCSACNGVPCGTDEHTKFCAHCGAPMTDEAVQMVMERLEKLKNEIG